MGGGLGRGPGPDPAGKPSNRGRPRGLAPGFGGRRPKSLGVLPPCFPTRSAVDPAGLGPAGFPAPVAPPLGGGVVGSAMRAASPVEECGSGQPVPDLGSRRPRRDQAQLVRFVLQLRNADLGQPVGLPFSIQLRRQSLLAQSSGRHHRGRRRRIPGRSLGDGFGWRFWLWRLCIRHGLKGCPRSYTPGRPSPALFRHFPAFSQVLPTGGPRTSIPTKLSFSLSRTPRG